MKTKNRLAILDPVGVKAGMEHYDLGLARGLSALGYKVTLYSNFTSQDPDLRTHERFAKGAVHWWNLPDLFLRYRKIFKNCQAEGIGTVILHLFHFNLIDAWLVKKARRMGFRLIGIVHDVEGFVRPTNRQRFMTIVERGLDAIVVHNRFSRDELLRIAGSKMEERLHVIPHGHDADWSSGKSAGTSKPLPPVHPNTTFKLLFFGMLKPTKGLETLLNAMNLLPPDVNLIVAGRVRPGLDKAVLASMRRLERQGRAQLHLRAIPADEVSSFFQSADVVVLPYQRVYQSGVLLRAWSEGLPVVLSDLPAFREVASESTQALFFPAGDADALRNVILRLKEDAALRLSLAKGGRERLLQEHSWKDIAREFSNLLA